MHGTNYDYRGGGSYENLVEETFYQKYISKSFSLHFITKRSTKINKKIQKMIGTYPNCLKGSTGTVAEKKCKKKETLEC